MKTKAFAAIVLTLFLLPLLFYAVPTVVAQPTIKIGVMGPLGFVTGTHMKQAALLAADEWGDVDVGGTMHEVELAFFDEFQGLPEGTVASGATAMGQLVAWGADFAVGGFRTESSFGARSVSADWDLIHFITGAATDNIIDCGDASCGDCVRCNSLLDPGDPDYDRYKYVFRVTPVNSSTLIAGVTGKWNEGKSGFLTYLMQKLTKIYGYPVKYAAFVEALTWAQGFAYILGNVSLVALGYPDTPPYNQMGLADLYLGSPNSVLWPLPAGYAQLATDPATNAKMIHMVSPTDSDLSVQMAAVKRSEARLIVHILSASTVGRAFTYGFRDSGIKAVAVGINVEEQKGESWGDTSGNVEFQAFLNTMGTRSPVTTLSNDFWDAYVDMWGVHPIYTAFGAYGTMIGLFEAIEAVDTIDPDVDPGGPYNRGKLIREIESTDALRVTGKFKYTGPNGIYHDVYSESFGPTWTDGYSRTMVTQWQDDRQEVVWPLTESPQAAGDYCKAVALPHASPTGEGWQGGLMYPYPTDCDQAPIDIAGEIEGKIDTTDLAMVGLAFGTSPGHERWQFLADANRDWAIDTTDNAWVSADFGKVIDYTLPYCNEADRWK